MLFGRSKSAIDYLVVGLGNPGMAYEGTRHNAGCTALAVLAKDTGITLDKKQFKALTGTGTVEGKRVLLLYPQTFMNNSGEAVQAAMAFYKLTPEQVLVLSDDISLDVGGVRVRKKGSDGGQKGLRSIICHIGTDQFPRIRIGVGAKPHPAYDLADWVLSKYKKEEQPLMEEAFEKAAAAARLVIAGRIDEAMNKYSH
ncbi:MAG: aminoacyl-tRNA hydrolase [Ruminococcaceae bacterium]|nr:aminoacyl-tRNA hydrolase [Oscillospiraceae bacterium]